MERETAIKILISSVLGLIVDQALDITGIIREALEPLLVGPFLAPIKPLILVCFFVAEIAGIYGFLQKLTLFEKLGLD